MGVFFAKNRVERPPPLQKFYTKQSRSLGVQTAYSWVEKRMPFLIQDEAKVDGRLSPTCPSQQLVQMAKPNDNSASDSESSNTEGEQQVYFDQWWQLVAAAAAAAPASDGGRDEIKVKKARPPPASEIALVWPLHCCVGSRQQQRLMTHHPVFGNVPSFKSVF